MAEVYPRRDEEVTGAFARERIPEEQPRDAAETPIADLLGSLVSDAQLLMRREFDLAKAEVLSEIDKARQGAIALGVGIGVTAVGGILLMLMFVHALVAAFGLPLWASYLIVGGFLAAVGVIMLVVGVNRVKEVDPVPHETIDSIRKDVEWLQEQNPSGKI